MSLSHFCPHCGADNAPGATFCRACQQSLDASDAMLETSRLLNNRYEILSELGAGGFGAVYKARDTQAQGKLVAVKQINLQDLSAQDIITATSTFNREADILSSLSHPLLPRIFDRFSDPEHWYLTMTFIDGQTLDEYAEERLASPQRNQPGLPLDEALAIALQLCDVLAYLHTQQPPVIFRDLKPGNIMRTRNGRLYLIDFGIARHFKPGQARDTIPFGSPGFAAPEQYGRAQTTPQADIYSLGALCFFLVSGDDPSEHPFHFPPLPGHEVDGLAELNALVQRMVALNPAERPADIAEVRDTLQHITQRARRHQIWLSPEGQTPPALFASPGGPPVVSAPLTPHTTAGKTSRRLVLAGSLLVGGVLLTGGLATYLSSHQPPANSLIRQRTIIPTPAPQNTPAETVSTITNQAVVPVPANGATYWSQDLRYAAVADQTSGRIVLYRAQDGQLFQTLKMAGRLPMTAQWSLDHSKFLATSADGKLTVWDTTSGQVLCTFALPQPFLRCAPPVLLMDSIVP